MTPTLDLICKLMVRKIGLRMFADLVCEFYSLRLPPELVAPVQSHLDLIELECRELDERIETLAFTLL